jgi:hypothetical protein
MNEPEINFRDVVNGIKNFPCRISRNDGEILKKNFDYHPEVKDNRRKNKSTLEFRYFKEIDGNKYTLLEEYLFRDRETFLDLKRAVGKNFYLNKE